MDENDEKAKREGGIDFGDVAGGRDANINLEHVAGRDIVTSYHYYGTGPERKDEDVARPLVLPGELPEVGDLPAGSRVVHRYNRFFVGREEELKELARLLQAGQTAAIGEVAGITGLGGVGKSQLAVALVYRYGRFFSGGVFWVSMANPEAIETEIALCGGLQGMALRPDFVELPLPDQVEYVRREWEKPVARLLIFDNCEEERLLEEFRPKAGGCRVVVTSRKGNWSRGAGVQMMALATLPRGESVALLRKHVPDAAAADLDAIAQELGDLPLALHLAGSFLERFGREVTPKEYYQQLRDKGLLNHSTLQGKWVGDSPTKHELHVGRTFALSYDRLGYPDPINWWAKRLLACAAWMAPGEPIPVNLLDAATRRWGKGEKGDEPRMGEGAIGRWGDAGSEGEEQERGEEEDGEELEQKLERAEAGRRLVGVGLLMGEGEMVTMHRLVGVYVQGLEGMAEALAAVEEMVLGVARWVNELQEPVMGWRGHLQVVAERAGERGDKRGADLCDELGSHLQLAGDYWGARPLLEWALQISERVLGAEHPETVTRLNNLGSLLMDMGEYETARPHLERALALGEKVSGAEHPQTLPGVHNLGTLLVHMGEYEAARPHLERALALGEKVLGAEHPQTLLGVNNLGTLLVNMGKYEAARPHLERAVTLWEKVLGAEHPQTIVGVNNLGMLLMNMGEYEAARPHLEQAVTLGEKVLGAEHPQTIVGVNNLGWLLMNMGEYEAARPHLERAVVLGEKVLGAEHPNTKKMRRNLEELKRSMN